MTGPEWCCFLHKWEAENIDTITANFHKLVDEMVMYGTGSGKPQGFVYSSSLDPDRAAIMQMLAFARIGERR